MENNRTKVTQFDALIVGGGFKGMMAAYGLVKQGQSVVIVESASELGGFMSPLQWKGAELDKGPQYLDGISEKQKGILDDIMSEHEPLTPLCFSYSSYWNNVTTQGFAIPDYRTLPLAERSQILFETLHQQFDASSKGAVISDDFTQQNLKSSQYIQSWCHKFLGTDAEKLSVINKNFVTFFGRKLLLDNSLSIELKKLPLLDNVLAAEKKSVNHQTYNLYPKGKNLGYFRQAFVAKLNELKVTSLVNSKLVNVIKDKECMAATIEDDLGAFEIKAKNIFFTGTVESTEKILLGTNNLAPLVKPVSQVFYYAEMSKYQDLPFYLMNYSSDSITRVTYFSDYAADSENGKPIICIEVPADNTSSIWQDPDTHFMQVKQELQGMGVLNITDFKAFKIPSTYRLILKGYESAYEDLLSKVSLRYGAGITVLTPHLLTRASIMSDLSNAGVLVD
ncbi:NAD(P)-binding protein [Pseudoalteromonas sp. HL-AS1]|uniref:NAD(P)/FAD-dependent oxidoreductase n=1 Tax=Pseudoalteromonas sp. HL-AS1 TaxID=3071081 RepID=UPI002816555C|nr:NAD(P)-binding protein [Pseudoalteromonas sp. HL-AS1]WMS89947.1 NAD(P)-binding protein [Pseudoalteromonas sp. HL-AS1]